MSVRQGMRGAGSGFDRSVTSVLVLDFDGTVAVGDEPAQAYARELGRTLDHARREELVDRVDAFLAGADDPDVNGAPDGYWAAASLARAFGVDAARIEAAYLATRVGVREGAHALGAPPELAPLLRDLRPRVGVALVSNAPHDGLAEALESFGIADLVDVVRGDANKPTGMPAICAELRGSLPADRLLSVGDIWVNDLEPVARTGGVTALIDRWSRSPGTPDFRAVDFGGLVADIRAWAAEDPDAV